MKTLSITEAKKNLGRWLNAAVQGEEVAIINGASVVALRPVEVEATDYAWREYGLSPAQLEAAGQALAAENTRWRRAGKLVPVSKSQLRRMLEQATGRKSAVAKTARRSAKASAR